MLAHSGLGLPNLAALGRTFSAPAQALTVGHLDNAVLLVFHAPTLALVAAQNIDVGRFDDSATDALYAPNFDQAALPGQILVQWFDDAATDAFYAPAVAFEAAQALVIARFNDSLTDQLYAPEIFGETTNLVVDAGYFQNANELYSPVFVRSAVEPVYTYPIGRGLYSDYGIRASMTSYKRRLIIGRR